MRGLLLAALLCGGCASALDTTGTILDILAPTPREECARAGGRYVERYDAATGRVLSQVCER